MTLGPVFAVPAPLVDSRVIIDNSPFGSADSLASVGAINYALNGSTFIDIPYVVFDLGSTAAVSSATFDWHFNGLYDTSPLAEIALYVGSDLDGVVSIGDRSVGTEFDRRTYSAAATLSLDVTSLLNSLLAASQFIAFRLEVTSIPGSDYLGGDFGTPSLNFVAGPLLPEVPETPSPAPVPAPLFLLGIGLSLLGIRLKRKA